MGNFDKGSLGQKRHQGTFRIVKVSFALSSKPHKLKSAVQYNWLNKLVGASIRIDSHLTTATTDWSVIWGLSLRAGVLTSTAGGHASRLVIFGRWRCLALILPTLFVELKPVPGHVEEDLGRNTAILGRTLHRQTSLQYAKPTSLYLTGIALL